MIGDKIKQFRKRDGLTQQELANKLNIARSTLASYERGIREPNIDMLQLFSESFAVDMNALLEDEAKKASSVPEVAKPTKDQQKAIDFVMSLEEDDLKKFVAMGKIMIGEK